MKSWGQKQMAIREKETTQNMIKYQWGMNKLMAERVRNGFYIRQSNFIICQYSL